MIMTDEEAATLTGEANIDWEMLQSTVGPDFLKYVLALPSGQEPADNDAHRQEVVAALRGAVAHARAATGSYMRRVALEQLCIPNSGASVAWATAARRHCGGSLPREPEHAAAFIDPALLPLAVDMFAASLLLIDRDDPFTRHGTGIPASMHQHPDARSFARSILADPGLRKLFPAHEISEESADAGGYLQDYDNFYITSNVIWSSGAAGTLQLAMIVESLLHYTFVMMRLHDRFDVMEIPHFLTRTMQLVHRLVAKKPAIVPVVAALTKMQVAEGVRVELPRGEVLGIADLKWVSPHFHQSATAMLHTKVNLQLLDVLPFDPTEDLVTGAFHQRLQHRLISTAASVRATQRELDRARLAMILGSGPVDTVTPAILGWSVLNPLAGGNSSWAFDPEHIAPWSVTEIDADRARDISEWGQQVEAHPESLWMGARRLMSAVTERRDPLDGLIDAVICWENMVGTGEGETTFRVCGALALLLEPADPARRAALFRELKDLYGTRSRLVHGAREPKPEEAVRLRDRCVHIAISAMRALYERPELRDAQTANERSRILLLGA